MQTLTINNFAGKLTRYEKGDINSGFAKLTTTFGNDTFSDPGNLTWYEQPVRIDSGGTVITDLIVAGKVRDESGISYVYIIGHTGRLYKIQINDPTTFEPNYDNPVLLATLSAQSPTFTRGGFIDFYGTTERIYIGHDVGVTRIDFDGANETFIGAAGSYTSDVPRPLKQFLGNLVFGNGNNIGLIDTTNTVTSYGKLAPAFPDNTQVRDVDVSTDGNYLDVVVSRLALPDITATTQDTTTITNSESYVFHWNGSDLGYTAYETYPSFSLNANVTAMNKQYVFGYDLSGSSVFNPFTKILTPNLTQSPLPNATGFNGNIVGWMVPEFSSGFTKASLFLYGSLDQEYSESSWYRQMQVAASGTETDILRVPFNLIVSNFSIGSSTNGYAGGVFGSGKTYFSTLEVSSGPTTDYKLYKFFNVSTGSGTSLAGVYETQTQVFSEKIQIKEVRFYTKPIVVNNEFDVDLIGSNDASIPNSNKTFTEGVEITTGDDIIRYTPEIAPTYALGLRLTNSGSANMTFQKVEIDYDFVKS